MTWPQAFFYSVCVLVGTPTVLLLLYVAVLVADEWAENRRRRKRLP